jgi:hypothetical protein
MSGVRECRPVVSFAPERRQDDAHQYPLYCARLPISYQWSPGRISLAKPPGSLGRSALSASDHRPRQVLAVHIACEQNAGDMQKDEDEHYVRSDLVHFFPEFAGSLRALVTLIAFAFEGRLCLPRR